MSKHVLILALVLFAPPAFTVETQQTESAVGSVSIEAQSNAYQDRGEAFPAIASYFAENNRSALRLVGDPQPSGEVGTKAEPPSARPGEIPADTPYPIHPPVWRKATEIYFNSGPPRQPVGVGYLSTCWSASGTCVNVGPPPQTWYLVDLTKCTELAPWCLPSDAAFAFVTAIMVQTSGNRMEGAGFGIVFRRPGDANVTCESHNYTGQTFLNAYSPPLGLNNNRAEFSTWIPLAEGKFEYCWRQTSTTGTFPTHPNGMTYAVNMSLQAWAR